MRQGETDLTKIRVPISILDADGALVVGFVPAAHELQTTKTGSALADAAGTLVEISAGFYYYQGVVADANTEGYLGVAINRAGYRGFSYRPVVGAAGLLTFPFPIFSDGLLATGCNPVGAGELQQSLNGAAFVAATGTFAEIGLGYYHYLHNVNGLATFVLVKVNKAGFDEALAWAVPNGADVIGGDANPPVITVVSPTPGVAPGAPGGFPADYAAAAATPIIVTITDASPGLAYVAILARFNGGAQEEVVYRRGAFRGNYAGVSAATAIANGLQFTVRNINGWQPGNITFALDPLDGAGNLAA